MRILVMSDLYPPHFLGGYELKCRLHVDELIRRGHEVVVLTSVWKLSAPVVDGHVHRLLHFDPVSPNLRLTPMPEHESPLRLERRASQLKWAFQTRRNYAIAHQFIEDMAPDIVYVWNMGGVGITPVLAAQALGLPCVFRLDDYWLKELKDELVAESSSVKRVYRSVMMGWQDVSALRFEHGLLVSEWVRQRYIEAGFSGDAMQVLSEGVPQSIIIDDAEVPDLPLGDGPPHLVHVGRLVDHKGTHVAIRALARLDEDHGLHDVCLDIIGTGDLAYIESLKQLVQELGLVDRVAFVGFIPHAEVLDRFKQYTAVLVNSLWEEPLAGTIAEGMARGLPVVTTDRGGNPEIIDDGKNGLLVPPGDPGALADAVQRLITDASYAKEVRLAGLATVRSGYTHEGVIDRVETYLESVARQTDHMGV